MADATGKPAIGFVGVGMMGWPMASLLVKAGYAVLVYDKATATAQKFVAEIGGEWVTTLADLGRRSDIVLTMLPTSAIVDAVLFGPGDCIAPTLRAGSIVLDMSSGVPAQTEAIGAKLIERGLCIVDAPVSGGVKRAVTGELAIMVGGAAADIDKVEPVLHVLGKSVLRTGKLGSGQAMKALNNLASAAGLLIGIEALLIGKKYGLDPAVMVDVLNVSSGKSNSSEAKFKQFILSGSFGSGFGLDLMVKDLTIALSVARDTGTAAPLAALVRDLWAAAGSVLGPGQDHTAIAKFTGLLGNGSLEPETPAER